MNTIVSLLAVVVVPSVQAAGFSGVGCPGDTDLTIEEGGFCNHGSGTAAQPITCCPENSNVSVPYQCDRSGGDASGGKWYVELPHATHQFFFFFLSFFFAIEHYLGARWMSLFLVSTNRFFFSFFNSFV